MDTPVRQTGVDITWDDPHRASSRHRAWTRTLRSYSGDFFFLLLLQRRAREEPM